MYLNSEVLLKRKNATYYLDTFGTRLSIFSLHFIENDSIWYQLASVMTGCTGDCLESHASQASLSSGWTHGGDPALLLNAHPDLNPIIGLQLWLYANWTPLHPKLQLFR